MSVLSSSLFNRWCRTMRGLAVGCVAIASALVTADASAQSSKLKVGDQAPELKVSGWLNGTGPSALDPTKIYVVEFWATWCGPCKRSIPHLNELHNELSPKGVVFMGISDEKLDVVKPFVEAKGQAMSYLVGVDESKSMNESWMKAAGQNGIPCAFIVGKDRRIAFIGHPMDDQFERTLRAVASGRFDPVADAKGRPHLEAARRAANVKNFSDASLHYDHAVEADPKTFSWVAIEKYKMLILKEKNEKAAADYGRSLLQTFSGDGPALGDFAVMIVSDTELKDRDIELAKAAAEAMIAASGRNDPAILDRYAAVQFHTGEVAAAVDTQMEAWMMAAAPEKPALKLRLDAYRAALGRAGASAANK